MFSKFLEQQYRGNLIAPTTANNYFNSVCRFYKHHLKFNYPFDGLPVTFNKHVITRHSDSLTSHIQGHQIELEVADCKPNISSSETARLLVPLSDDEYKIFFKLLLEHSSIELFLICLTAVSIGLRANEVADLRVDMISKYSGSGNFDLRVGPQASHRTKKSKNGNILSDGALVKVLLKYNKSHRYLKRLSKYSGDRANVFLARSGKPYDQKTISTLFNNFMHGKVLAVMPSFSHKFHDLRTTFGVYAMKGCLDVGFSKEQALAHVQRQMRHRSVSSTWRYLEYWERSVVVTKKSKRNEELLADIFTELASRGLYA